MEVNLFALNEEVFYGHLFPFLKFNDLLRLRRVSKQMKVYSDGYIRNLCVDREIEINEDDRTLGDFLRMDLPVSSIYINNSRSGKQFFKDPAMAEFLQFYASTVRRLRVAVYVYGSRKETNFYSALTNLKSLELDMIQIPSRDKLDNLKRLTIVEFPPTFENLKTLKLSNLVCRDDSSRKPYIKNYIMHLLTFCMKLEYLRLPLHNGSPSPYPAEILKWNQACLLERHKLPNEPNLKYYDMLHHNNELETASVAQSMYFLELCHRLNVTVVNAGAEHLEQLCSIRQKSPNHEDVIQRVANCCSTVVSLRNIHRYIFGFELPVMEKLVIRTSKCSYGELWSDGEMPKWPNLKCLDLTIDSALLETLRVEDEHVERRPTAHLLLFLFGEVHRENLKELIIRFDGDRKTVNWPRANGIIQNCGNITKLHIVNWAGTNKVLSQLWDGLTHLEDVTLKDCTKLGNVAFVGENKEEPTFLKLKNLNRFELSGLELMPKITDLVFELVFRHLKLKQISLYSRAPIKSITTKGIRSLLTGEFNAHVEKFPFDSWSMENVSEEEFALLKSEFRASLML